MIDRLTSEEFKPENYKDEYRVRLLGMLDEKSKGKEIVIDKAPAPKHGQVIDIMEALIPERQRSVGFNRSVTEPKTLFFSSLSLRRWPVLLRRHSFHAALK